MGGNTGNHQDNVLGTSSCIIFDWLLTTDRSETPSDIDNASWKIILNNIGRDVRYETELEYE